MEKSKWISQVIYNVPCAEQKAPRKPRVTVWSAERPQIDPYYALYYSAVYIHHNRCTLQFESIQNTPLNYEFSFQTVPKDLKKKNQITWYTIRFPA